MPHVSGKISPTINGSAAGPGVIGVGGGGSLVVGFDWSAEFGVERQRGTACRNQIPQDQLELRNKNTSIFHNKTKCLA